MFRIRSLVTTTTAVLALAVLGAPAGPAPVLVANTTFTPVADSYVDSALPASNFGTKTYVYADNSPVRTSYLRFDVSGVASFASVALRLYVQATNSTGVAVRTADSSWVETQITAANAPAVGPVVAQTGKVGSNIWVTLDLTGTVLSNGPVTLALTTTNDTAMKIASRETGATAAQLVIGDPPPSPSPFLIGSSGGGTYTSVSQTTGATYSGSLKFVGESAVGDLMAFGGGTVNFAAGTFDLGSEYFKLENVRDIVFAGAGTSATVIRNSSGAADDTEPFNFSGADRITIRDLTVVAGGPDRTTSDAIDFDKGNASRVERVAITDSRGRGIVFDGKNAGWTADGNTVLDCVITGVPSQGIEFLASSNNRVEGCTITGSNGHGIQAGKSSSVAAQPNKKSSGNVITGNTITEAGGHGIIVNSGDGNQITNNTITNSSDAAAGRSGIRIQASDNITCNDNVVSGNSATDNQATRTQKYGLDIASALCNRTVVGAGQTFTPNLTGAIRDVGTATVHQ